MKRLGNSSGFDKHQLNLRALGTLAGKALDKIRRASASSAIAAVAAQKQVQNVDGATPAVLRYVRRQQ